METGSVLAWTGNVILQKALSDPDLFDDINNYFCYWKDKTITHHTRCDVCHILFSQPSLQHTETATKLALVKKTAIILPLNAIGLHIVWYVFKQQFNLSPKVSMRISPLSVHLHLIAHLCYSDSINSKSIIYPYIDTAIKAQTIHINPGKTHLALIKRCLDVFIQDLSRNGCGAGYVKDVKSRCRYSSLGNLSCAQMFQNIIVDARRLVSPQWVIDNKFILKVFHQKENLFKFQPGVRPLNYYAPSQTLNYSNDVIKQQLHDSLPSCNSEMSKWCKETIHSLGL